MATPTVNQIARIKSAIISKAIRFLVLPEAPFGSFGEVSEYGGMQVSVKPDFAIKEMMFGLMGRNLVFTVITEEESSSSSSSAADEIRILASDVIRVGMGISASDFPDTKLPDVDRCILAAADWVNEYLNGYLGLGEADDSSSSSSS